MTVHALQEVREQQAATKKHNRDLSGLIRQAIIDRIKTAGECFADDLVGLYLSGEVKECRRLATAQFGTMVSSGLIREKERRKSTFPERKGAKSGVYIFTMKGREQLVGSSIDNQDRTTLGADRPAGVGAPVDVPSDESSSQAPGDSPPPSPGASSDSELAGVGADIRPVYRSPGDGRPAERGNVSVDSGEKPTPVVHQQTTEPGATLQAPGESSETLSLLPDLPNLTDPDQRRAA